MAGYLLYFPSAKDTDRTLLKAAGLDDLARDGAPSACGVLANGPDGGGGVILHWPDPLHPERNAEPGHFPDRQVWYSAKPDPKRGLAARRFWLGLEVSRPPTPEDLRRRRLVAGKDIFLGDGHVWHVPAARQLPMVLGLDAETGEFARNIHADYRSFWEASTTVYGWFFPEAGQPAIPYAEAFELAAIFLGLNYRVSREIVDLLGLFTTDNLVEVCSAIIDYEAVVEVLAARLGAKKKADPACTPAGSPSSAGGTA